MPFKLAEAFVEIRSSGTKTIAGELQVINQQLDQTIRASTDFSDLLDKAGESSAPATLNQELQKVSGTVLETSKGVLRFATNVGKVTGAIGLLVGGAKLVYDLIVGWMEKASGLEAAIARSAKQAERLAELEVGRTKTAIEDAERIYDINERKAKLEERLAILEKDRKNKGDASIEGLSEEEIQHREKLYDAVGESINLVKKELQSLDKTAADKKSEIAEKIKQEEIALKDGAQALREYQLVSQGMDKDEAAAVASREQAIEIQKQEAIVQQQLADAFAQSKQDAELRTIELQKGTIAAERERNIRAGMSKQQADEIASIQKRNELIEKSKNAQEKYAESMKAAADEKAKQDLATKKDRGFSFSGISQLTESMQTAAKADSDKREQTRLAERQAKAAEDFAALAKGGGLRVILTGAGSVVVPGHQFGEASGA